MKKNQFKTKKEQTEIIEQTVNMETKSLIRDKRGLSTVEYVIILILVAVFCISVWETFGTNLQTQIQGGADAISDL